MLERIISVVALVLATVSLILLLFFWQSQPKIAYVKNADIFSSFKGTKELKARLEGQNNYQKTLLDSMSLELSVLRERFRSGEKNILEDLQTKEQIWIRLSQEYNENYAQESQDFTNKAWVQINQYIIDYGKMKKYDYIIGTNGTGTLMYGSEREDLTEIIITYINKKYDGE